MSPLRTQGNAFSGPMSIFSKATLVYVVAAVSGLPNNVENEKVNKHMSTGVVAQK